VAPISLRVSYRCCRFVPSCLESAGRGRIAASSIQPGKPFRRSTRVDRGPTTRNEFFARRRRGACLAVRVPVATERPECHWDRRSSIPPAWEARDAVGPRLFSPRRAARKDQRGRAPTRPVAFCDCNLTARQRVSEEAPRARSRQLHTGAETSRRCQPNAVGWPNCSDSC
jgi:hypothetical protein